MDKAIKHSPLPWVVKVSTTDTFEPRVIITRDFGVEVPPKFYIAFLPEYPNYPSIEDANFIVCSVNNFEALLEAAKDLLIMNEANPKCYEDDEPWFQIIQKLNLVISNIEKDLSQH